MSIYKKEEEEEKLTQVTKIQIKAKKSSIASKAWSPKKWATAQNDQAENA
jgi:hypothetical protein